LSIKRRTVFVLAFAFLSVSCLSSVPASPRTLLSSETPVSLQGFEGFVEKVMAEWKVPGLAVAVIAEGRTVYARGFGYRDLGRKLPVTPQTVFGIGSCSKAFTATTMGILVDDKKIEWDKPVRDYLPAFKLADEVASARLTPRDLITHRTGLPRHDYVWIRSPLTRREMFDRLRFLDFSRDIRQVYQYNNLMVMTAGYLVGAVAGTSWEEFARTRILDPLGMADTNFSTDDSQRREDFSRSYTLVKGHVEEFPFYNADALGPAGSVNSTAEDMAKWLLLNLNKGAYGEKLDKRVVSERTLAQIHAPQVVVPDEIRYSELFYPFYGMGWRVTAYRGRLLVSHGGAIMGFSALAAFMPRDGFAVVLLNNLEDAPVNSVLAYNLFDRLLGLDPVDWPQRNRDDQARSKAQSEKRNMERDADRKVGTVPSHPLSAYVGEFEHPAYGSITVALDGNGLRADYHQRTFVFEHFHYDVFKMKNDWMGVEYRANFVVNLKGDIAALAVPFEPSVEPILFAKKAPEV
ncbi:MAG: serine hydrolase, partial [Candidatus Aminicenantes bacterium]|nr:serine hydrolase [Candidatus Aminicenantes bacterium]